MVTDLRYLLKKFVNNFLLLAHEEVDRLMNMDEH